MSIQKVIKKFNIITLLFCIIININCFAMPAKEPNRLLEKYAVINRDGQYTWSIQGYNVRCFNYADSRFQTMYIGLHYIPSYFSHSNGWYYFDKTTGIAKIGLITLPNKKHYYACNVPSLQYGMFITGWQLVTEYYCYFDRDDYSLRCCLTPEEYRKFILENGVTAVPEPNDYSTRIIYDPSAVEEIDSISERAIKKDEPYALEGNADDLLPDKNSFYK